MSTRHLLELLLLGAIWGASFLFMRIATPEFGPVSLIALRVSIAAVFLSLFFAWRQEWPHLKQNAGKLLLLGAINSAIPFSLFAYSTLSVTAGFAAVLNATAPLWASLIAWVFLHEKLGFTRLAGLLLGFAGVTVLVWGKISFKDGGSGWAVCAGLFAALLYGIATHFSKRKLSDLSPKAIATGSQFGAAIVLLPLMFFAPIPGEPSTTSWLSLLALGVFCTAFAYLIFFDLLANVGPAKTISVTYLVPVFGMLWGAIFLHEAITLNMIAGIVLVFTGVAITTGILKWPKRS